MVEELSYIEPCTPLPDKQLRHCADLLLLNADFTDSLGLGNGKMGIAIFFYHYARYSGSKQFENYADELIDQIYEEINVSTPSDFEKGLAGIGWGIEYLVSSGFIEGDTDEILNEIDLILSERFNDLVPEECSSKKKESGYDLYQKVRGKGNNLNDNELLSFINLTNIYREQFTIPVLIKPESYGLFGGIAGEALLMVIKLNNIRVS
jgi:hypothetical protein